MGAKLVLSSRVVVCVLGFLGLARTGLALEGSTSNTFVVTGMSPARGSVLTSAPSTIGITFNNTIKAQSVRPSTVTVVSAGPDHMFNTADDAIVPLQSLTVTGNTIQIGVPPLPRPSRLARRFPVTSRWAT